MLAKARKHAACMLAASRHLVPFVWRFRRQQTLFAETSKLIHVTTRNRGPWESSTTQSVF